MIPQVVIPVALATALSLGPADAVPQVLPEVLRGTATWFHAPVGTAAAGPRLRRMLGRHWRGTVITVVSRDHPHRRVRVRLTDWCACSYRRVVDLNPSAFRRLAPLSQGVVRVRIKDPT